MGEESLGKEGRVNLSPFEIRGLRRKSSRLRAKEEIWEADAGSRVL